MNVTDLRIAFAVLGTLVAGIHHPARADNTLFRAGDELIVQLPHLNRWRNQTSRLTATLRISGAGVEKVLNINLSDRVTPESLVIDLAGCPNCTQVSVDVRDGSGKTVFAQTASPIPTVKTAQALPLTDTTFAAIEPGSQLPLGSAPRIPLPDMTRMRIQMLSAATRTVDNDAITYPVFTDADLPGIASNNTVVLSRQTAAPDNPAKASLYFSYRKAIYDPATTKLKEWRKMLVEVPLDPTWVNRPGDEPIQLPLDGFAIHTTEERELANPRWNDPRGYNMLGGSSSGLFQGGQSAEVDHQGRIYISNVGDGAGIVRFNPKTARFEQPPVNLVAELRKMIPADGDTKRNWDLDLAQLVCTRGRLFVVFDRNYKNRTQNGTSETCNGVVSLPLEHWNDPVAFTRDLRLHAACWPDAQFPLYAQAIAVGGSRRLGAPQATQHGLVFANYRLDLDANGNTQSLSVIQSIGDTVDQAGKPLPPTRIETIRGLPRQRYFNLGAAGRPFVRQAYGEFAISKAALALSMPDTPPELLADETGRSRTTYPGAPPGELTVRFDITAKIKGDRTRLATLADAMVGISQGPNYAIIDVPGEPDQAIAVCDYNYFLSKLDFSRRTTERKVFKSYLPLSEGNRTTEQPASIGLGPYNTAWIEHDNARWLYIPGYTGIARFKFAEDGKPVTGFRAQSIHRQLDPQPIDGAKRDSVKDFLNVFPAIDNRLINIGRGRPGRGGGARSAGLELFDPRSLGKSQTAVEMTRCYGLYTPVSRLVFSTSGKPVRQEVFVASGNIRPEYLEDISDPAKRPANQDPKIFAYECISGAGLRDLYGFALPTIPNGDNSANLALSPCRQFLVILQGTGTLLTYSLAERRFVDGVQLRNAEGKPIQLLSYSKPSAWIGTAPDGQIFFRASLDGESAKDVHFFRVQVAPTGAVTVQPHLRVHLGKSGSSQNFERIVHCFLPDLLKNDGSYDLILGGDSDNGGQPTVRVIDDFVPPAR